jgi:hypothetical protein
MFLLVTLQKSGYEWKSKEISKKVEMLADVANNQFVKKFRDRLDCSD